MSLRDHVSQISRERSFYERLSKQSEIEDPSLTVDGLLDLCYKVEPGQYLQTGGFYFELFILRFGMEKHRKLFLALIKKEDKKMSSDLKEELHREYAMRFWFETISKLSMVHKRCNTQLFLLTLTLDYRGLSRLGMQFVSFCGVATHPRTFDRKRNVGLETYDKVISLC